MSLFDKSKVKLQALEYAERNKIVNQKSIDAYVAGFNVRDSANAEINLKSVQDIFQKNYDNWETDCGYCDLRNDQYQARKLQGYEAKQISDALKDIIQKIKAFNKKNGTTY